MALATGTRLGPYEVLAPLGAGGMGEVYRARDTRLGREVAIKVLPQHLSANPEVRARFEREARTVSGLNHPHICVLHDVGREADTDYLVMELVDGGTLAQRLTQGALPVPEVLRLGAQIADALDRAHRAGVVHRDLKPGNVMLTRSGAKLMDFGLARATGLAGAGGSGPSLAMTQSPTMAQPLTAEGSIVGTFQYMAPEQLEGREADGRADLWALGCVLYEMATGKRAFEGTTQASLISAIMRDAPRPMSELAPLSPRALERLVGALLAKNPDDRVQTAHDVRLQLQWAAEAGSGTHPLPGAVAKPKVGTARLAWAVAVLAVLLAVATWLSMAGRGAGTNDARARLMIPQPTKITMSGVSSSFALSPDGRAVVFVAADSAGTNRLWLRPLDGLTARPLPGTENGFDPFWSPDSRNIAFFADARLKKVGLDGGAAEALCDAPDPRGGSWGSRGTIVFAPVATGALFSVAADGGAVTEVARPDSARGETALRFPEFLPDGRQFVFVTLPTRIAGLEVRVARLGAPGSRAVMYADAAPVFAEPGWLVTTLGGRLVAQRFNAQSGRATGKPLSLGEAPRTTGNQGVRAVSAARGLLAYASGRDRDSRLAWLDRAGQVERWFALPRGRWEALEVSPDGERAVVSRKTSATEYHLWLVDLRTGQAERFTSDASTNPVQGVWSPDGGRIAFHSYPRGPADLFVQDVEGNQPQLLLQSESQFNNPYSWSADGSQLVFEQPDRATSWDLWMVSTSGDGRTVPLIRSPSNEAGGWVSPDGRWMAYETDESGAYQVYVTSFSRPGRRFALGVTGSGTGYLSWSRDGREIIQRGGGAVSVIAVEPGSEFQSDPPRRLFDPGPDVIGLDAAPDHKRFLATIQVEEDAPRAIVVDLNWVEALKGR